MKKLSLKVKLTILYTFFMTLVTCLSLAILFSLSSQEILTSVQSALKEQVADSFHDIQMENGRIDLNSDFYDLDGGVYLSLYSEDSDFLYGRIPYGFPSAPPIEDQRLRTLSSDSEKWYVFDLQYQLEDQTTVYVRGITSLTDAEASLSITLRLALIVLPLLTILTAFIGYRMTSRALKPVKRITDTVKRIQENEDLSQRIGLSQGRDEIYELADTFDQMLQKLEEAFVREKQFTSDVSHELRTPVAVTLSQCDVLLSDPTYTQEQKEQIQTISRKAREMSQMISHLLLLTRADQGRQKLQLEDINISELAEMAAEEQSLLAARHNITVETQIQPDIIARADETFFIRLLVNLLSNAVSYGKDGGYVKLTLTSDGREATGIVEDNGIGISPEALPHIWERFFREDSSRTVRSDEKHSGLGLSMVQWIVKAHHGTISAESTPGEGSRFTFQIPLKSVSL